MLDIIPWRRKRKIEKVRDEFDEMFDRLFQSFSSGIPDLFRGDAEIWPDIDVIEDKKNIIVKAEVPGMEAGDFDISISDNVITIKGEKKQEKEEKEKNFYLMERRYGSFIRSIPLPAEVDNDKVEARYKKGVLKIVIPKKKESKESKIKVHVK